MLHFSLASIDAPVPVLGPYFESFYLPLIGPTAVVLQRHLVRSIPDDGSYVVHASDLAAAVGLGLKHSALQRQLARLTTLRLLDADPRPHRLDEPSYLVRSRVRTLNALQLKRLPPQLAALHDLVAAPVSV